MINGWIIVSLTLLYIANILLLGALAYSARGKKDAETKAGFGFMAAVLILNMIFVAGGITLW